MPRAADIAAALGEKKLKIRTAEDLGLGEYVTNVYPLSYYRRQQKKAEQRSAEFKYLKKLYQETRNPQIGYLLTQRIQGRKRYYWWRVFGGSEALKRAWAARRIQAAQAREQKVLDAERERQEKLIEACMTSTREGF